MKVLSLLLALLIANFGITSAEYIPEVFRSVMDFMKDFVMADDGNLCKFFTDCTNIDPRKIKSAFGSSFEVASASVKNINTTVHFFGDNRRSVEFELESNDNGASYKIKSFKDPH